MNYISTYTLIFCFGLLYVIEIIVIKASELLKSNWFKIFVTCSAVAGATIIGLFLVGIFSVNYSLDYSSPLEITIPRGASLAEISDTLLQKGLISNSYLFRASAEVLDKAQSLQAGRYKIEKPLSMYQILDKLSQGGSFAKKVTIPEGTSIYEIGGILTRRVNVDSVDFVRACFDTHLIDSLGLNAPSFEGYLYPETYDFYPDVDPRDVISKMYKQFRSRIDSSVQKRLNRIDISLREAITLASIIEEEARVKWEQPIISGVYHNRLDKGMLLQADPSVRYALKKFEKPLSYKDLKVGDEYNTYRFRGLPPGPISNPGWGAIKAALYPDTVEYLYFVSRMNGTHKFSKTILEHNRAKRRIQRRQSSN